MFSRDVSIRICLKNTSFVRTNSALHLVILGLSSLENSQRHFTHKTTQAIWWSLFMQRPARTPYVTSSVTSLMFMFSLEQGRDYPCEYILFKCASASMWRFSFHRKKNPLVSVLFNAFLK